MASLFGYKTKKSEGDDKNEYTNNGGACYCRLVIAACSAVKLAIHPRRRADSHQKCDYPVTHNIPILLEGERFSERRVALHIRWL